MRHYEQTPAAATLLPELLPFIAAIERHQPREAAAPLRTFLHDCSQMIDPAEPGYARGSLLTAGGYPVEFGFRCDTADVYVTTETGPARETPRQRLTRAQDYTSAFAFAGHPLLAHLAAAATQRYGSWLSYRSKAGRPVYKLYQEITPETAPLFWQELVALTGNHTALPRLQPMMVGFAPGEATITEYYLRIPQASPTVLHQLFALAGCAAALPPTLDYLGWLGGLNREQLLGQVRLGVSFQAAPGQPPGITLFAHINQLCPDNSAASTRLLSLARQLGYSMPLYQEIAERLTWHEPDFPVHGIISLKPLPQDKLFFSFGMRPW